MRMVRITHSGNWVHDPWKNYFSFEVKTNNIEGDGNGIVNGNKYSYHTCMRISRSI